MSNSNNKSTRTYNVLVVGCHPDDVELGCGGTIAKHLERGDSVYALTLTNGEQGKHAPNLKECLQSYKTLGIPKNNSFFAEFPDGYIRDDQRTVNFIEELIKQKGITRVYTHHYNDRHQDHRNCSKATSAAARKVNEIYLYEGPSTNPGFDPHIFLEISKSQLQKKLDALSCYQTQIKKGIVNLDWIKSLAGHRGFAGNVPYAEAFAPNHIFRGGSSV